MYYMRRGKPEYACRRLSGLFEDVLSGLVPMRRDRRDARTMLQVERSLALFFGLA